MNVDSDAARIEGIREGITEGCRDRVGGRRLYGFAFTCKMLGEGKSDFVVEGKKRKTSLSKRTC